VIIHETGLETLLTGLKPVEHRAFQSSIKESGAWASACYVLPLGDLAGYVSEHQEVCGQILMDIATSLLAKHRKSLVTQSGSHCNLYEKFITEPHREVVQSIITKGVSMLSPSCFFGGPRQITFYVSLKNSFHGQSACVRAILNHDASGKASNNGELLHRVVVSG